MADYTYPTTYLDRADQLLALLGSFWSSVYQDSGGLAGLLEGVSRADQQRYMEHLQLVASVSRFEIPVFKTELWRTARLKESERNLVSEATPRYGSGHVHGDGLVYGDRGSSSSFAWPAPTGLASAKVIVDRVAKSNAVLTHGIDFKLVDGLLVFASDPFAAEWARPEEVYLGGEVVDRTLDLWVFRGEYDIRNVQTQFGHVVGLMAASGQGLKDLTNAVFDCLVHGTTELAFRQAWSAATGVPVAVARETVEEIDPVRSAVVTDKNVYKFPAGSVFTVAAGDALVPGDTMVEAMRFFRFPRGEAPAAEDLPALAMGPGLLSRGYIDGLVFENVETPLIVETNVDGFTKVSWKLGGWPGDVDKFFDDMHAKGVAYGRTMAHLLDVRDDPADEPEAASLPATINPLAFLISQRMRNNFMVVKLDASVPGGLPNASLFRRIVPPWTAVIVSVDWTFSEEIEPGDNGDDPGVVEALGAYDGTAVVEEIDAGSVAEEVSLRSMAGRCH